MLQTQLVAVPLGIEPRCFPLARLNAIASLRGILFGVGDVDNVVSEEICLVFARTHVAVRKLPVFPQPYIDGLPARHSIYFDDLAQAQAIGYALADGRFEYCDLFW